MCLQVPLQPPDYECWILRGCMATGQVFGGQEVTSQALRAGTILGSAPFTGAGVCRQTKSLL